VAESKTNYYVRFKIYLKPSTKPEDWPNPVFHDTAFETTDFMDLRIQMNKYLYSFIKQEGVVILKESKKPQAFDLETLDLRRFIPMNMIAYIEHETKIIEEEKKKVISSNPFDSDDEDGADLFN
jgi:hypothetical protein